jgi:hypothetical protein
MDARDASLHILQHALGLDDYGRDDRGRIPANVDEPYRNRYVISERCDSWALCMEHVEAGRMSKHGPSAMFGGADGYCFCVTEAGLVHVRERSPTPPKRTRSQKRYDRYLDADSGLSFGEWLKEERRHG